MPVASHRETLRRLITLSEPIHSLQHRLATLDWEAQEARAVLTRDHIRSALLRFLNGEFSAADLEAWAGLIEERDDIDFEEGHADQIAGALDTLANLPLSGDMRSEHCQELIDALSS